MEIPLASEEKARGPIPMLASIQKPQRRETATENV